METKVETVEGPGGATAELATVTFEGKAFTALGSCVDHANGVATGYVSADGSQLKSFAGLVLGRLKLVSKFRNRRVGEQGIVTEFDTFCYRAEIDGRKYHGRGSGPGMLLRLRACK